MSALHWAGLAGLYAFGCLIFGYYRGYRRGRSEGYSEGFLTGSETKNYYERQASQ